MPIQLCFVCGGPIEPLYATTGERCEDCYAGGATKPITSHLQESADVGQGAASDVDRK